MIFGINTTSDISKLLYVISHAARRMTFETIILKYHEWYLCQISHTNYAIINFVYTTTCKRFVIFMCRNFKLSWNTTALSQSDCRNFLHSSIKGVITKGKIEKIELIRNVSIFSKKTERLEFQRHLKESSRLSQNFMNQALSVICSEDKGNPTKT